MARHAAAEIVVSFADTTLAVVHVRAGDFVVGRARDAQLPLDVAPFALVSATPHGFAVRTAAAAPPRALDGPLALAIGHVAIRIAPIALATPPLPRRRIEPRPLVFGAGSLAAHLAIVLAAAWLATPDEATVPALADARGRPTRIARFAVAAQTKRRAERPPPVTVPITTDDTETARPAPDQPAAGAIAPRPSQPAPHGRGRQIAPRAEVPGEGADDAPGRRFDPDASPAFDTVKVGDYTTVATGAAAGDDYRLAGENGQRKPVIVVSCDASTCLILGGDPASGVREALEARLPDIAACYAQHAHAAGQKVELDFGIDERGRIGGVSVGGVGDYDACVANIISSLAL